MAINFAALEARANAAIMASLSNCTATLGGVAVTGIFDNAYALGEVGPYGVAGAQPTLTLPTANVPTSLDGLTAVINGVTYFVTSPEPDGTGLTRLQLRT